MNHTRITMLALVLALAVVASDRARAQARTTRVGDVVLYHLGDVDRPALVLDEAGPTLRVFLTPADEQVLEAERWEAQEEGLGHRRQGRRFAQEPRTKARGSGRSVAGDRRGDVLLLLAPDERDWSPR